uniref:Uncharacterized protein n=1 Tax=Steinernema glaseri TaxID=37863 RepID=A0A1I7YR89_9BILA
MLILCSSDRDWCEPAKHCFNAISTPFQSCSDIIMVGTLSSAFFNFCNFLQTLDKAQAVMSGQPGQI